MNEKIIKDYQELQRKLRRAEREVSEFVQALNATWNVMTREEKVHADGARAGLEPKSR